MNIDNYTTDEMLAILGLDESASSDDIVNSTNAFMEQFSQEGKSDWVDFFQDMQDALLEDKQTDDWIQYQTLPQKDETQQSKSTDRMEKVDVYGNDHMPMNRQQLGVNNVVDVPVVQDSLNPNLKNITNRHIVIDSQFRQSSGGTESASTDFTLDLSDPLTDVLSLRFYSIQVPYTWYTIDSAYGNTCLWVTNSDETYQVSLEEGNYIPSTFCAALNAAFVATGFYLVETEGTTDIATFNTSNGKITLNLEGWTDPGGHPIITFDSESESNTDYAYFTFFDVTGEKSCFETGSCSAATNHTFDNTLGWVMGFRLPREPILAGGNTPESVLNLYGTKYFILVLDDYNQNHINNGLVTITELSKTLPLPSYYTSSQPYVCNGISNSSALVNLSKDKVDFSVVQVPQVVPSAPRTLTQAQIYTINEILKNRSKTTTFRSKAPTNSDTFAIIPLKYNGLVTGQLYTELSGQFQDNKRIYFGPVDIDRIRIRLLDDKGNVVNLHGADWCICLISENLYQY